MKNILLADTDKRILYLSETYEGNVHDKKIADQEDIHFEQTIELLQDTGFQGFHPKNAIVIQPLKKPKGKEFTDQQKEENRQKASQRVVVEHAIGQVKIFRVVKEKLRSYRHKLRDQVIYIACGLNNLKVELKKKSLYAYST